MSVSMTGVGWTIRVLAVVVLVALVGVACGGSGDGSGTSEPAEPIASSEGVSALTPTPGAADPIREQVDRAAAGSSPRFGEVNSAQLVRMTTVEEDGPFYMVNLVRFRERASYPDGRDADLTGREANDRYAMLPILLEIGAQPVFVAEVENQLLGGDIAWEQVAIVRYPSRAAFLEMTQRPDYLELAVHKDAGVEMSIVLVTEPIDWGTPEGAAGIELADSPFPATDDDPPFSMVHVFDFHDLARYEDGRETDLTGREALSLYDQNVAPLALARGVRPVLRLEVEGTLVGPVGDDREWDEVRIVGYPSHAAFSDMTSDAGYAPGLEHRIAALAFTYSMMTLPLLNQVSER